MVTSHTYALSDAIDIAFTDSGAPIGSTDYTTLVIFHGSAFTGCGFEKLHAYAHQRNLRAVIWNRRDYPGSTKYTDAELQDYNEGRKVFLDRLSVQLADFLKQFIGKESVPKINADRKSGGFALMGWSMGSATAMPLFSDPNLISGGLYTILESYVKDLILYDPPYLSFGYELPADHQTYNPWTDPNCKTPEELYQNFGFWVSSYYDHPDMSGSIHGLDYRKRTDQATITSWTPEEFQRNYCESAAVRSELRMYVPPMQGTLNDLTYRVLFDEHLTQTFFPRVPVTYISANRSNWQCIWGYMEAKRYYEKFLAEGKKIRATTFFLVEGGNHFVHGDMPKELMDFVVAGIRG
ncbi:hypothetical protein GALMADRAFT_252616 [Galerina marginata CBS 339.88]|uniref:AB hydrolase-1 domain-containing protein n=1 Tax=Galerina marginata (strain CBS 339.88) TaxID=685588 RepID=A0A067SNP6_GALM3|nr:hypothetical protein GALMADRAFT_252616 [Galerina marginata CBS 339.88]